MLSWLARRTRALVSDRAWKIALLCGAAGALAAAPARAQLVQPVVRQVNFQGLHDLDPDLLAASIITTEADFFRRVPVARSIGRLFGFGQAKPFNPVALAGDVLRLKIVITKSGYPAVTIDTVLKRSPGVVDVTFKIHQGPPVRVLTVAVLGIDSVDKPYQIRQDLPITAGDVSNDFLIAASADTVVSRLHNRGYPYATVSVQGPGNGTTQHLVLNVNLGPYTRFGPIHVIAAQDVDTALVAKLVTARPGHRYEYNALIQSQRFLYTSDLYRLATVTYDSTAFAARDSVLPLDTHVISNFGHRVLTSVGYGTDDCFRVGAGWTARNSPGSGLVFDITGQLSKIGVGDPLGLGFENNICHELKNDSVGSRVINYGVNASLRRNAFLAPANTGVVSLFATQHSEFEVYLRREVGVSASITRLTAADVPISLSYRIADGTTTALPASFCAFFNTCDPDAIANLQKRRLQATLTLSALRQRLNNPLDPSRGSILSASIAASSRYLGSSSTQQFVRIVGDASGYLPIGRGGVVLAGHLRLGAILAPKIDVGPGESGNFVPPDQRFYVGGANDVRGYAQNELGPLVYVVPSDSLRGDTIPQSAVHVAPTGGTRVTVGNIELRLPTPIFAGRVRVAVFADAGALWNAGGASPLRVTPGVGLRYSSPIGPIRLDVAWNPYELQSGRLFAISTDGSLTRLEDDFVKLHTQRWRLQLSIGQAF